MTIKEAEYNEEDILIVADGISEGAKQRTGNS